MKFRKAGKKIKQSRQVHRHGLSFEIFEPRILLSADAFGVGYDQVDDGFGQYPHDFDDSDFEGLLKRQLEQVTGASPLWRSWAMPLGESVSPGTSLDLDALAEVFEAPTRSELIVIDASVPDAEGLLAGIREDPNTDYQLLWIDADANPFDTIGERLAGAAELDAIHIVSHGASGALQLGATTLTLDNFHQFAQSLEAWGAYLADDADLLLYGCNLAAGEQGEALLSALGAATGMDIKASTDLTASSTDGDWDLEYQIGVVESQLAFDESAVVEWQGSLATIIVNSNGDMPLPPGIHSVDQLLASENNGSGVYTLRQALQAVQREGPGGETHTILFELDDNTINIGPRLPVIDKSLIIDGTSDADFNGSPVVVLTGKGDLLTVNGNNVTIRGLVIAEAGGIGLTVGGSGHSIVGNHVLFSDSHGIRVVGENITIGGVTEADRNVVSGNGGFGISVDAQASNIVIQGNYIGTDIGGTLFVGNEQGGILATKNARQITIGGDEASAGNVISGNAGTGILLEDKAHLVKVKNNFIGTAAGGEGELGNRGAGIQITSTGGSSGFEGTEISVEQNVIAYNYGDGINVLGALSRGNLFIQNLIYDNNERAIDLNNDGRSFNDPNDFDDGSNHTPNFPVITDVSIVNGQLRVVGSVTFSTFVFTPMTLHFYGEIAQPGATDVEAAVYIGSHTLNTHPVGTEFFDLRFDAEVPNNFNITATVTHIYGTSELSDAALLPFGNSNAPPVGEVLITGSLLQGAILSASNNLSDGNGVASPVSYQWRRNGVDIAGANQATYRLTQADVGAELSVQARYTDGQGKLEQVLSDGYGPVANVNDAPGGSLTLSGLAREDQELEVVNMITDADGLAGAVFVYQWYRDDLAIEGANDATYRLGDADVGSEITVEASYIDDQGQLETVLSAPSSAVTGVNDLPTGDVLIRGEHVEDVQLRVENHFSDADGLTDATFSYQWLRDGLAITGATDDTYTLTDQDVGSRIRVVTSYTDDGGTPESVTSAATGPVANINDDPLGDVQIIGQAIEDRLLEVLLNFTDDDGLPGVYQYQWWRDGERIDGAEDASYTLDDADVGSVIAVSVSYVDGHGTAESIQSQATLPVAGIDDPVQGDVRLVGTAREDEVLTAVNSITDDDGLPGEFTYSWFRDGALVPGANTDTYRLDDADVGSTIRVEVSFIDLQGGFESVLSGASSVVEGVNDDPTGALEISGDAIEYQVLNAANTLADDDGISGGFGYQWYRDGLAIDGATGTSYELSAADIGAKIQLEVRYTDDQGTLEVVRSAPTDAVLNVNSPPTGFIRVTGIGEEDQTLTALLDFDDEDGLSGELGFQWYRDSVAINGANQSDYTATQQDVGREITLTVRYTDDQGSEESIRSSNAVTVANVNDPPVGTVQINGSATEASRLEARLDFTDGDGLTGEYRYQWYRDDALIEGANDATLLLTDADVGSAIRVVVSYTDAQGTDETVASLATSQVTPTNHSASGTVRLQGLMREDQTLSVELDVTDANGLPAQFNYQWYRDGVAIAEAQQAEYRLGDADVGSRIQVEVFFEDARGFSERLWSEPSSVIVNVNDLPEGRFDLIGEATEDQWLAIDAAIVDRDGLPDTFTYQWFRDGQRIAGATGLTYQLSDDDVGAVIHAQVSYRDLQGTEETLRTANTQAVVNLNDAPSGQLTIVGQLVEDQRLRVEAQITDDDGLSTDFSYQWFRNDLAIEGANQAFYRLGADDVESQISVRVGYTDDHGTDESLTVSREERVVMVNHPATGNIIIRGIPVRGETLHASADIMDVDGVDQWALQWLRDGEPIAGATAAAYKLTGEDSGKTLSVLVSFIDARGFDEAVLSDLLLIPDAQEQVHRDDGPKSPDVTVGESSAPPATEANGEQATPSESEQTPDVLDLPNDHAARGLIRPDRLEREFDSILANTDNFGLVDGAPQLLDVDYNDYDSLVILTEELQEDGAGVEFLFPDLNASLELLNAQPFRDGVDRAVEDMKKDSVTFSAAVVGGTSVLSASLSVGYVIWTLRSGILVTSLLSSLPAWRFIDPLPILSGNGHDYDEDDESLESLVEQKPPTPKPEASTGVET